MDDDGQDYNAWGLIGQVGFIIVIALAIGLAVGLGLDNLFHSKPIMTLVGVTIGFALGLAAVYRTATQATRRAEAAYMKRRKASGGQTGPTSRDNDD